MSETQGKKYDSGKLRWDLLPYEEVEEVVAVLTTGAIKYGDENWKYVENAKERYFAACMRHIVRWKEGEKIDKETAHSHLAHAICNLLFLMYFDKEKNKSD